MQSSEDTVIKKILVFPAICACLAACGSTESDPEAALRTWVANAELAAEEKDRRGLLAMISENYVDSRGNDHDRISKLLQAYFYHQQTISLLIAIDEISLLGDTAALLRLTVGMAGTNGGMLGISADAYDFEFELEVVDDDWLLIGARWGELGANLH
jgi:hypothetical protein